MKIAYVVDQIPLCGGILVPFEHCKGLREKGYDAFIVAKGRNPELQMSFETVPVYDFKELESFTDEDVIVSVWYPQVFELEKYKGRKIQFVQGHDLKAYVGDDQKKKCLEIRNRKAWEIMAVSDYAGSWTGRDFTVILNGINNRFFEDFRLERDIDILIEGNDEENKNIPKSFGLAFKHTDNVGWLSRDAHNDVVAEIDGNRVNKRLDESKIFKNPPQDEIPKIYQRAKIFLKLSESEGFCLPILEAMASRCQVVTQDMGGNDWCDYGNNCIHVLNLDMNLNDRVAIKGFETSLRYTWERSIPKLEDYLKKSPK